METTPLDGYKKISVTVLTTLLTVILFFVKDPVHASTLEQFWSRRAHPHGPGHGRHGLYRGAGRRR